SRHSCSVSRPGRRHRFEKALLNSRLQLRKRKFNLEVEPPPEARGCLTMFDPSHRMGSARPAPFHAYARVEWVRGQQQLQRTSKRRFQGVVGCLMNRAFGNVNEDEERARAYATLQETKQPMKGSALLRLVILLCVLLLIVGAALVLRSGDNPAAKRHSADLEYLKAVDCVAPLNDPELLFVLMTEFVNSNLQGEGAEFFSARLKQFESQLTSVQKSLYLSIVGLLRAQNAHMVSILRRIGYVKETIAILDQAKQLSGGNVFVVNWIAGVVRTELPGFFGQRKTAQADLAWCVEHADKAPHPAWLREVYYHLGKLALNDGDNTKAQDYLRRSGYSDFDRPITLATPFSEDKVAGHAFAPRRIREVIAHRVYALSGFEFTEYYFVVSKDGRELIAIDAGTRPDFAKGAYEALKTYAPGLPPLTTAFITHAHWDHVGGHSYFRSLNPRPKFYGRGNYQEEFDKE